jgi:DNA-binding NarL/FixJ family response regulator
VLIVDPLPVIQEGVQAALEQDPSLRVVGVAGNVEEALLTLRELEVDVILTEIELPGQNVVRVIERLRRAAPQALILVLTLAAEEEVRRAIAAGARGSISKRASAMQIAAAVSSTVMEGTLVLSGAKLDSWARVRRGTSPAQNLSDREVAVLKLLSRGMGNRQIATKLHVSVNTVRFHVHRILEKLGCRNRTQAAVIGIEMGLVDQLDEFDEKVEDEKD